ncbi:uncharacterized protein J3D65DRAFT_638163 [Phyllosticta citribraziliensis]|uniref:Secreted protein n=1 Tax=Phyllosticta citribraziliensis TaxID=989973 RepID=A0ABR1L8P3_9PEZI
MWAAVDQETSSIMGLVVWWLASGCLVQSASPRGVWRERRSKAPWYGSRQAADVRAGMRECKSGCAAATTAKDMPVGIWPSNTHV